MANADAWSARLAANHPETVADALSPGTLGQYVKLPAVRGSTVDLVVRMAKPEGWLPVQEATLTAAGRPTLKKRSTTSLNVLYGGALASEVLRLVKLTFTRAPSIATVRISVVQSGVDTAIFQGRFDRDRPAAWDTGSTDRETLLEAISTADAVRINNHNRTHEFKPIASEAVPSSGARSSAASRRQDRPAQTRSDSPAQPASRQQLVDVLASSSDGDERYEAIRALRENSGPELHDVYVAAVHDSDKYVRRVATQALKDLSDPADVPRFIELLQDADEDIRYEAINALRDQPSADLGDVFRASLGDNDRYVCRVAVQALRRLEDARDTATFVELAQDPDEDIRYEAICALRDRVTPELHPLFVAKLDDGDRYVRRTAVQALSGLKDPGDTRRFVSLLTQDSDDEVRYQAALALTVRLTPELRFAFEAASRDQDKDVRDVAASALKRLESAPSR